MPGGDRTGPMGMGPMTGRGAGYCAGSQAPGYMAPGFGGGGFGRGRAGGRGRRNMFLATGMTGWQRAAAAQPDPQAAAPQEIDALRTQAESLADTLNEVKNRIEQLEKHSQG